MTLSPATLRSKLQPTPQKGQVVRTFLRSQVRTPLICLLAMAPVGQMSMHWPQKRQKSVSSGLSNEAATWESNPRSVKSMASVTCTSWHTRTHLPQRMHLFMSRSIIGLSLSMGSSWRSPSKVLFSMP